MYNHIDTIRHWTERHIGKTISHSPRDTCHES